MKILQVISFCLAGIMVIILPAWNVGALEVSGKASTMAEFISVPGGYAGPVYQYLSLNLDEITESGLRFRGYGRLATDPLNKIDTDSRLYIAYFENLGLYDGKLDFKLGRNFIVTSAGASMMDGLKLKINDIGLWYFGVFFGADVKYHEIYTTGDFLAGMEAAGQVFEKFYLNLSFLQKWDNREVANMLFGFDLTYDLLNTADLYTELQYSQLDKKITYFLGGIKVNPHPKWTVDLEYLYSLPVFSATSIYSVFAAKKYQEIKVDLDYSINRVLTAYFRFTREIYKEFEDASVFEAGLNLIQHKKFSGYLSGIYRAAPEGQDLSGLKIGIACWLNDYVKAGAGAHLDVLERRIEDTDDTTSNRLWIDVSVFPSETAAVHAKFELVDSALWERYTRASIRLDLRY